MADEYTYGIDVSRYNTVTSWSSVENDSPPKAFVFIKATEGVGYIDPACADHASKVSTQTKMLFGYYHYATLKNATNVVNDATSEADAFASAMRTLPAATLIPVLDLEDPDTILNKDQTQQWIGTFVDRMNQNGFPRLFMYSAASYLNAHLPSNHPFGSMPLWVAHYTTNSQPNMPAGWSSWDIWQYTCEGAVSGVSGNCDVNKTSKPLSSFSPNPVTATNNNKPVATPSPVTAGRKKGFAFFGIVLGRFFFFGLIIGRSKTPLDE